MLSKIGPQDEQLLQLRAIITRQAQQLTRLVDDLLDVSRLVAGKMDLRREPVNLEALAKQCLSTIARPERLRERSLTLEAQPAWVEGDPARLEQVLTNLIDNALKYTPPGGRISVTIRPRARKRSSGCATPAWGLRPSSCRASSTCSCRPARSRIAPGRPGAWARAREAARRDAARNRRGRQRRAGPRRGVHRSTAAPGARRGRPPPAASRESKRPARATACADRRGSRGLPSEPPAPSGGERGTTWRKPSTVRPAWPGSRRSGPTSRSSTSAFRKWTAMPSRGPCGRRLPEGYLSRRAHRIR